MRQTSSASHWRRRADEARSCAATLRDPEAQRKMLGKADTYDWLAETTKKCEDERRSLWDLARPYRA